MPNLVDIIIDSTDNLIAELIIFRHLRWHPMVKRYMKSLNSDNMSPYMRYCIDKYYFKKDVKEVPIPQNYLKLGVGTSPYVTKLIESQKNVEDQIKILKKHQDNEEVAFYVQTNFPYLMSTYPYLRALILNYYYDVDYPIPELNAKSLNIKLYKIYFKDLEAKKEKKQIKKMQKKIKHLKVGNKIKVLSGPFAGMDAIIKNIQDNLLTVEMDMFGETTELELDSNDDFKIISKN